MRAPVSVLVAIVAGLLVLAGYFIPVEPLLSLRVGLTQWAVILAAFGLLVGVANLVRVHWDKVRTRQPVGFYSLLLIVSLAITFVIVLWFGPTGAPSMWIFNNIQVPVESSLAALLVIVLAYTCVRLLSRRPNTFSVVFVLTVLLVLLGTAPLLVLNEVPLLSGLRAAIVQTLAMAGARGILLGVALGTVAMSLRILMGVDRPYGG
jgi:hypothetical protein